MKVVIEEGCISCGACVESCPNVFRFSDTGTAEVYNQPKQEEEECAKQAAELCPVGVIHVE